MISLESTVFWKIVLEKKISHASYHSLFIQSTLSSYCDSVRQMSPENRKVNKADMAQTLPYGMESLFLWKIKQVTLWLQVTSFQESHRRWGEEGDTGCYDSVTFWRRQNREVIFVKTAGEESDVTESVIALG